MTCTSEGVFSVQRDAGLEKGWSSYIIVRVM
jgi:hypothetical protein